MKPHLKTLQNQTQFADQNQNPVLLAHGVVFINQKCSHWLRIGHTVDKFQKVHGHPPVHPHAMKSNMIGIENQAATT